MRHASTQTTERYYCRTRAEPAFARVNEAYNSILTPEPAISAKNDIIESKNNCLDERVSGLSRIRTGDLLRVRQTS
jgi:hypothetical protein